MSRTAQTEVTSQRNKNDATSSLSDCPEPYSSVFCLNGATCFSFKINNSSLYNCWCRTGYHGLRCEFKYIPKTPLESSAIPVGLTSNISHEHQVKSNWSKANSLSVVPKRRTEAQFLVYYLAIFLLMLIIFLLLIRLFRKSKIPLPLSCVRATKVAAAAPTITNRHEKKLEANRAAQKVDYANINYDTTLELNKIVNQTQSESFEKRHLTSGAREYSDNRNLYHETGS